MQLQEVKVKWSCQESERLTNVHVTLQDMIMNECTCNNENYGIQTTLVVTILKKADITLKKRGLYEC